VLQITKHNIVSEEDSHFGRMNYVWGTIGWFFGWIEADKVYKSQKRTRNIARCMLKADYTDLITAIDEENQFKMGFYAERYSTDSMKVKIEDNNLQVMENKRARWFHSTPETFVTEIEHWTDILRKLNVLPGTNYDIDIP